jgi:hypothetical protein
MLWVAFAAAVAVFASGCDSIEEAVSPAPPEIKHVTVAAKVAEPDAKVQGWLRPGAPPNLPLWGGASVLKSKFVESEVGTSWSVTLVSSDSYPDVVKGMAAGFERSGWQVNAQDVSSKEGSTTVLTVADKSASGMVTIAAEKDKTTQISYVISASR